MSGKEDEEEICTLFSNDFKELSDGEALKIMQEVILKARDATSHFWLGASRSEILGYKE